MNTWPKRRFLARAQVNPHAVVTAAILVAAIGESMAVSGLVLALLGVNAWALALYALCLLHGIHLALRWPDYEHAAARQE